MSVLEKRKAARGAESKRRGANKMWLLLEEPVTMGDRIRFWRIAQGLVQQDLAERAGKAAGWKDGLSKTFLSLLESGRTRPLRRCRQSPRC